MTPYIIIKIKIYIIYRVYKVIYKVILMKIMEYLTMYIVSNN